MLQQAIVAVIVLLALGYALWRLAPAAWRRGLADAAARAEQRGGPAQVLARQVRVHAQVADSGCGTCGRCGGSACPRPSPERD